MSINHSFLNKPTNITAKIIKDSINIEGNRVTTFELEYPRFIHAEFMTHRQLSKNSSSSRAIPSNKMIDLIKNNPAMPIYWGKNKSGMQAKEEVSLNQERLAKLLWKGQMYSAFITTKLFNKLGLHKQISNRILEPFQMIKIVCTATEWDNFFNLRYHLDAQPEIIMLAHLMYQEYSTNKPKLLQLGQWHLPYVDSIEYTETDVGYGEYENNQWYYIDNNIISLEDAIKISVASCAAVSYRTENMTLEKANKIYDMLIKAEVKHSSPLEHQAICVNKYTIKGITHYDKQNNVYSGNLKGWVQNRHLLKDNTCNSFDYKTRKETFNKEL